MGSGSTLPEQHPARLTTLADEIRVEVDAAAADFQSAVQHAVNAGEKLTEAKSLVKHGEWLPWLEQHFPGGRSTAANYMRLAANVGRVAHLPTVREAVAFLAEPKSQLESSPPDRPAVDSMALDLDEEAQALHDRVAGEQDTRRARPKGRWEKHRAEVDRLREERWASARAADREQDVTDDDTIREIEEGLARKRGKLAVLMELGTLVDLVVETKELLAELAQKGLTSKQVAELEGPMADLLHEYEVAKGIAVFND